MKYYKAFLVVFVLAFSLFFFPVKLSASNNPNYLFVSSFYLGTITRINLDTLESELVRDNLYNPEDGVCDMEEGVVYFSESVPGRIKKLDLDGNILASYDMEYPKPEGLALDSEGNLYFNTRRFFNNTWGVRRIPGADFNKPHEEVVPAFGPQGEGVAIAKNGDVLAVSAWEGRVVRSPYPSFGSYTEFISGIGGETTGIIVDEDGYIYVSTRVYDSGANIGMIKRYDDDGNFAKIVASGFKYPQYLERDSQGNFYLADIHADRVYKIHSDGEIEAIFEQSGVDGLALCDYGGGGGKVEPFLDLPWDYKSKGMSFTEAATAIQSYFDHEYPLLDVGGSLKEPIDAKGTVINFEGGGKKDLRYSSHDGYDWIFNAGVTEGDLVLAAGNGIASFKKADKNNEACGTWACGNVIIIDHENGFQTRYYHLQDDDSVSQSFTIPKQVSRGQPIGRVGSTGRSDIPHIHFSVLQDKTGGSNFDEYRPEGMTDPFGWQGEEQDPWPNYKFSYKGQERTGNISNYLWISKLSSTRADVSPAGGESILDKFKLLFPPGAVDVDAKVSIESAALAHPDKNLKTISVPVKVTLKDKLGNLITDLKEKVTIVFDYSLTDPFNLKEGEMKVWRSPDGVNWYEVETTIDANNMLVLAETDQFSYFVVTADRDDVTPPVTEFVPGGVEGENGWFSSSVEVRLDALDNQEGTGVYYTGYRLDQGYFRKYTNPILVNDEGEHFLEFYSVDNDGNIEEVKNIRFTIDKKTPNVGITADPTILWPPDKKMMEVYIDGFFSEDNILEQKLYVEDEYGEVEPEGFELGEYIELRASRRGNDIDGRLYEVIAYIKDMAHNIATASAQVLVPHDQR